MEGAAVLTSSLQHSLNEREHLKKKKKERKTQKCFLSLCTGYTHVLLQEQHSLNIYNKMWIKIATSTADVQSMNTQNPFYLLL